MSTTVRWITDPGHAWLEVSLADYPDALDYGTGYGYRSSTHAYLEEDCEAPAFLRDHSNLDSRALPVFHTDADAACRSFERLPAVMPV